MQNWPRWKKDLNLAALLSVVGLVGAMKTVFLTTNALAAEHYRASYVAVAALTGVPLVLSSATGAAACVAARVWGRRPVYLLATALLFVGSVWNATAGDSFGSCMGARAVQGLGWGVFDTLVMTSIQDTYFVSPLCQVRESFTQGSPIRIMPASRLHVVSRNISATFA